MRADDAADRVKVLETIDEAAVRALLARMASDMHQLDRDALKEVLRAWIGSIELDPATRAGRITYRLTLSRFKLASPPRHDAKPAITVCAYGTGFAAPWQRQGRRRAAVTRLSGP